MRKELAIIVYEKDWKKIRRVFPGRKGETFKEYFERLAWEISYAN